VKTKTIIRKRKSMSESYKHYNDYLDTLPEDRELNEEEKELLSFLMMDALLDEWEKDGLKKGRKVPQLTPDQLPRPEDCSEFVRSYRLYRQNKEAAERAARACRQLGLRG
jgi:predicted transcriptional regulator